MEASEIDITTDGDTVSSIGPKLRIFIGVMSALALLPVAGMVFVFAIIPAMPFVLAMALVIEPRHWFEAIDEEVEVLWSHRHHVYAHA